MEGGGGGGGVKAPDDVRDFSGCCSRRIPEAADMRHGDAVVATVMERVFRLAQGSLPSIQGSACFEPSAMEVVEALMSTRFSASS